MPRSAKSTLGRGLSALLSEPASVEAKPLEPKNPPQSSGGTEPNTPTSGGLQMLPVSAMEPGPFQPRQVMGKEALDHLAASIKQSGVMQPILVRAASDETNQWQIVAGERRWRAAKRAGLASIPAIVRDLSDQEAAELALVENEQREDLNAIERGFAYRTLYERFGLSHADIGERVGADRSTVANLIRLTELEPELRELIANNALTGGHGKALLMMPAGTTRVDVGTRAAREGWSVRRLEAAAKDNKRTTAANSGSMSAGFQPDRADLAALERQLGNHLGAKVAIDRRGSGGGVIRVLCFDADHFESVTAKMGFSLDS